MNSNRLLCNIRNVKRPIIGLVQGRKIVRDELNVEISKRQYLNIMNKCSVYGIVNGDELVVYSGARFDELLEIQNAISAKNTKPVEEVIKKKEEKVEEVKPIIEEPKVEDIIEEPIQPVEEVIPEIVSEPNIVEEESDIEMVQYTESNEEVVEENTSEEESVSDNDQNTNKYNNRNNRKNKRKNH